MSFSSNDPCGGSGIQADIETLGSLGCHCVPVITAISVQDTTTCYKISAIPNLLVVEQARAVLQDMPIAAIKIGMLGSVANVRALHSILKDYPNIPVVLDPVLHSENNRLHFDAEMCEALIALLMPLTTICIPDATEAKALSPQADTLDACAQEMMGQGADYILLTGGQTKDRKVLNSFYGNYRCLESFQWDIIQNDYLGFRCTLSTGISALLAQGLPTSSAVHKAQQYAYECLKKAYRVGMGKPLLNRLFWARESQLEYDTLLRKA
ncbi:MAG: hydroxymethylpyrimidine/phosphomethylpyrimidine kinase [Gammaproteobacteria bacterium]